MIMAISGLGLGMPTSSAHYYGGYHPYYGCTATNIHITPLWVEATGYNSASGGYYKCTGKFLNYNPVTKHWGVLEWNPKHTREGEWTARDDDMDFSINGRCKGLGWQHNVWLVKTK